MVHPDSSDPGRQALARAWRSLATDAGRPVLDLIEAECLDPGTPSVAELQRLRQAVAGMRLATGVPAEALVQLALGLLSCRRRAGDRIEDAGELLFDRDGLEQASGTAVARHKAQRFRALAGQRVVDLCCGVGGDARELVRSAGCRVLAVDRDPVRALMAAHNAGCRAVVADVARWPLEVQAGFHLDPARRDAGSRRWRLEDFEPGPEVVERFVDGGLPGAVKLGPGLDLEALPWGSAVEVEILGDRRGLRQAVLWCGSLAAGAGQRTASCVDSGLSFTAAPEPAEVPVASTIAGFLWEPHAALERAGLVVARLLATAPDAVGELAAGLGLFTASAAPTDGWFTGYRVVAELPLQERGLRRWLREHDAGVVAVKTRGGAADAGQLQRALRGAGQVPFTVFALRVGAKRRAVITEAGVAGQAGDCSR